MNCVSCDICVYHLGLFVFFPGVFLSSRVTGACPVTTDLIMRVNVRTTTTVGCAHSKKKANKENAKVNEVPPHAHRNHNCPATTANFKWIAVKQVSRVSIDSSVPVGHEFLEIDHVQLSQSMI